MAHIPFAFSVSHFINSVGADAGFASIIGLAILVLLYFAQARETSTLRSRADDAEQRAGALEARLAQVSREQSPQTQPAVAQRPAAARPLVNPAPGVQAVPAGGPAVAPATAAAALPAAPAGVGAPALSSATRLIPLPGQAAAGVAVVAAGADLAAQVTAVESGPGRVAAAAAAPVPAAVVAAPQSPAGGAPRPATAAGAAQAAASPSPAVTAIFAGGDRPEGPGAGTNGTSDHGADEYSDEFTAVATDEPEPVPLPRVQLRPGGGGPVRPAQPAITRYGSSRGPSGLRRGVAVLLAVLGIAAVAAVLLIVTSSGGSTPASSSSTATTNSPAAHHRTRAAFAPSSVSVGVLNGTAQAGLAAKVMGQLSAIGYKQGITPANAASQTQARTVVGYLPGERAAAIHVAAALKLSASTVQPIDSQTQQIACPQTGTCAVDVVVIVGQDLAGG
jgi:hypothetical protein